VRIRAKVRGEGDVVVVSGIVQGFASYPDGGHVDIAVYAADGRLLVATSAPYVTPDGGAPGELAFEKRLPGLRGRRIRLRLLHHDGTALPQGSPSCPDNVARDDRWGSSPGAE
jgi:hypothetical protein